MSIVRLYVGSRKTWGAAPPNGQGLKHTPWSGGVHVRVHHTAGAVDAVRFNYEAEADYVKGRDAQEAVMRRIQRFHQRDRGWVDIAYNYVIFPSGDVYEGRGYQKVGAHTDGHNHDIGICFAGNYETQKPTVRQLIAYWKLRRHLRSKGAKIIGTRPHRATSATSCPGKNLVSALRLK